MLLPVNSAPRLLLSLAALVFGLALAVPAAAEGTQAASRALMYRERLASFGRRVENSDGERAAAALVTDVAKRAGLSLVALPLARSGIGHAYSSLLEATLPGLREDRLVFTVPLGAHADGPDDEGDAALAVALAEMERLGARAACGEALPVTVSFVFLGAERRGRYAAHSAEDAGLAYGSASWIDASSGREPLAVVYLSFDAPPESVALRNSGGTTLSPYWHYERVRSALADSGLPYRLAANRMQISRLGFSEAESPIRPYLEAGIPAVELAGEGRAPATMTEFERGFFRFTDALYASEAEGFRDTWDRHYLSFQLGRASFVLREKPYIVFLVIVIACTGGLVILFAAVKPEAAGKFYARLPATLTQLASLFVLTALVYLAGAIVARFEAAAFGSADYVLLAPRSFAAARLSGAFFLTLAAISLAVRFGLLSPNPYFYEFAALVCLGADVFVFGAVSPPFAFYFVWAFFACGFSLLARKPWASLAACLLMYAPLFLLAGDLVARPPLGFFRRLVAPGAGEAFLLAAAVLPFNTFTASPLLFFRPHSVRGRRVEVLFFLCAAALVEAVALGAGFAAILGEAQTARLRLSERVDQDAGLASVEVAANHRLDAPVLTRNGVPLKISPAPGARSDRAYASVAEARRFVDISSKSRAFLGRELFTVRIACARPAVALAIRLESERDLHVHDCSLPYLSALDGRSVEIFVGENPPNPLKVELATPEGTSARIVLVARYLEPLGSFEVPPSGELLPGTYELAASAPLRGGGVQAGEAKR